jgi:hypothetical protein
MKLSFFSSRLFQALVASAIILNLQACSILTRPALEHYQVQVDISINHQVIAHSSQELHPYYLVQGENISDIPFKHPMKVEEKNNTVYVQSYYNKPDKKYWLNVHMNFHHVQKILQSSYEHHDLTINNQDLLGGDYGVGEQENSTPILSDIYMSKLLEIPSSHQMQSVFTQSFTVHDDTHPEQNYQEDIKITIQAK